MIPKCFLEAMLPLQITVLVLVLAINFKYEFYPSADGIKKGPSKFGGPFFISQPLLAVQNYKRLKQSIHGHCLPYVLDRSNDLAILKDVLHVL